MSAKKSVKKSKSSKSKGGNAQPRPAAPADDDEDDAGGKPATRALVAELAGMRVDPSILDTLPEGIRKYVRVALSNLHRAIPYVLDNDYGTDKEGKVIAGALEEAFRGLVTESRKAAKNGAEKKGNGHTQVTMTATNPKTPAAASKTTTATKPTGEKPKNGNGGK